MIQVYIPILRLFKYASVVFLGIPAACLHIAAVCLHFEAVCLYFIGVCLHLMGFNQKIFLSRNGIQKFLNGLISHSGVCVVIIYLVSRYLFACPKVAAPHT